MRVVAFAGPSLPDADGAGTAGVEWRPPAEAGDLLGLDLRPGLTICLIDGYFDHRPAVRHKEILLALAEGARVIGASSMGALRAAEMGDYGMVGVGAIFRAYASGTIVGDDEVALVHGPAAWEWKPLSVPLVEVRVTICRLVRSGRIDAAAARRAMAAARLTHYSERSWAAVADDEAQRRLLEAGHVQQKRIDAVAALHEALAGTAPPPQRTAPISTSFLRALARERGFRLPPARSGGG